MSTLNSGEFENLVVGRHSSGIKLVNRFKNQGGDFSTDIIDALSVPGEPFPPTKIGKSIHCLLCQQLIKRDIDPTGFILRSTVDTKVDAFYDTDMVGWVPSIPNLPVTIDLFNLSSNDVEALKNVWMRSFLGSTYSQTDEQNDLFLFNKGLFAWRKTSSVIPRTSLGLLQKKLPSIPAKAIPVSLDFRLYASRGRPANHFILTPYHIATPRHRKNFARMVADYLSKNSSQKTS